MSRSECCGGCCCKLLCSLLQVVITAGFVLFFWWLIFRPRLPRASIHQIQLSAFNLTDNNSTLHFNLTVAVALRNPNKRVNLYYDALDASLFYGGEQIQSAPLPLFYQRRKNTTELQGKFDGIATGPGAAVAETFRAERAGGTFNFEVRVDSSLRMKLWFVKIGHFHPKFDCKVWNITAPPQGGGGPVTPGPWTCDR
ncbi:NDR1/HIN1-like protein 10 [Curcuma longa]|uniref:NDR1/HIN1-like protein 10 n=1 Tax=Curcuma longa TaxID=136217 RepID=UPI003D9E385B